MMQRAACGDDDGVDDQRDDGSGSPRLLKSLMACRRRDSAARPEVTQQVVYSRVALKIGGDR
jgi:hypothetical protein